MKWASYGRKTVNRMKRKTTTDGIAGLKRTSTATTSRAGSGKKPNKEITPQVKSGARYTSQMVITGRRSQPSILITLKTKIM